MHQPRKLPLSHRRLPPSRKGKAPQIRAAARLAVSQSTGGRGPSQALLESCSPAGCWAARYRWRHWRSARSDCGPWYVRLARFEIRIGCAKPV